MPPRVCCQVCGAILPSEGGPDSLCPACLLELGLGVTDTSAKPTGELAVPDPDSQFGDYQLLQPVARGGMGVVYKARQVSLDRVVAIKMLLSGRFAVPEFVERFRAEALAAAQLRHPNIVAIHDFGSHQGHPYLAMEFVDGRSLADLPRDRPLPPQTAATYVSSIARAVAYAHAQGVLHRDLKPANILLDKDGQVRITDFGLAKQLARESELTIPGQMIGSPSYSPPEQLAGRHAEVGPSSDVYSLGAVLYQLLSGRAPFVGDSVAAVVQQVQEAEAISPRLLNPAVPEDLETICLKCLDKEPRTRYPTAQALADDLDRFLRDEPILARPISAPARLRRWCRRKPGLAALSAALAVLLGVVLVGSPLAIIEIAEHARREEEQRRKAEATVRRLEIEQAQQLFTDNRASDAIALLAHMLRENPADQSAAEWLMNELLQRNLPRPVLDPISHPDFVHDAVFTPDGRHLLTVCRNNAAWLWDAHTGRPATRHLQHDPSVIGLQDYLKGLHPLHATISPNGLLVATASADRTARLWSVATGQPLCRPLPHPDFVYAVAFSPDGTLLATGCKNGFAQLWNVANGQPVGKPFGHPEWVNFISFSPDGQFLVTASDDRTAQVWETASLRRAGPPLPHQHWVREASFSPDGQRILTASEDHTAQLWDAGTSQPIGQPLRHAGQVFMARFSPDGRWVATASLDKTACVWDGFTGQPLGTPLHHAAAVRSVQFSPDGQRLLTASEDATAMLWDVQSGQPLMEPARHQGAVWSARFSPDGKRIATASSDKTARIWDVRPSQAVVLALEHQAPVNQLAWHPDSQRLMALDAGVHLWNLSTAITLFAENIALQTRPAFVQFDPAGQRVVVASNDKAARLYDLHGRRLPVPPLWHEGAVEHASFSPDGALIATASADRTARLWDSLSGELLVPPLQHPAAVYTVEFSPNSDSLATTSGDFRARIWQVRSGQLVAPPLLHYDHVNSARFSPNGRWVLTASHDGTARLWDARSGRPVGAPLQHRGPVRTAVFNPQGDLVVTSSRDHSARVWHVPDGQPLSPPLTHDDELISAAFDPEGRRVVTAARDRTARIWDARSGQALCAPLHHGRRVTDAQFSPNGRWLATASADRQVRVWPISRASGPVPAWLPTLAEAVVQQRLGPGHLYENVPHRELVSRLQTLTSARDSDPFLEWGRWMLADPSTRPVVPGTNRRLGEHLRDLAHDAHSLTPFWRENLLQVLRFEPAHPVALGHLARFADQLRPENTPQLLATLDWLSQRALNLDSNQPAAWWARARFLARTGAGAAALSAMQTARDAGLHGLYFDLDWVALLMQNNRVTEACEILAKTVESASIGLDRPPRSPWEKIAQANLLATRIQAWCARTPSPENHALLQKLRRIPPHPPSLPPTLIDLTRFYNASPDSLGSPAPQSLTLGLLPFDFRGFVRLSSSLHQAAPAQVQAIPVHQSCSQLHFLHTADEAEQPNTPVATYTVHYHDDTQAEIPILYGRDLGECKLSLNTTNHQPPAAWSADAGDDYVCQLFITTWTNPRPDIPITAVDFTSRRSRAAPLLGAITVTGPAPPEMNALPR